MGEAVDRVVKLARVVVPSHVRHVGGKLVRVEGYTYNVTAANKWGQTETASFDSKSEAAAYAKSVLPDANKITVQAPGEEPRLVFHRASGVNEVVPTPRSGMRTWDQSRWDVPRSGSDVDIPDYDSDAALDEEMANTPLPMDAAFAGWVSNGPGRWTASTEGYDAGMSGDRVDVEVVGNAVEATHTHAPFMGRVSREKRRFVNPLDALGWANERLRGSRG